MAVYEPPDLTIDRDAILQDIIDDVLAENPSLQIVPSTAFYSLLSAIATRHADELQLLSARAQGEFQAYGEKVVRIPPASATQASTTITVTNATTSGQTLPAGTQVTFPAASGDRQAFATTADVTIAASGSGQATIIATVAGAAGTGLQAGVQLERTLAWIGTITVDAPTTGGADGETDDDYVNTLADELQLFTGTILPNDLAIFARNQPGVARAMVLDNYDASTATAGVGGHATVALVGADGLPVGPAIKAAVLDALQQRIVSNAAVHVIDPTYTAVAVAFTAVSDPGFDAADVQARAEQAVLDALAPGNHGRPRGAEDSAWVDKPIIRIQDVSAVLNGVDGLDYWTALTLNGIAGDLTLNGPASLPTATAAGTVT